MSRSKQNWFLSLWQCWICNECWSFLGYYGLCWVPWRCVLDR